MWDRCVRLHLEDLLRNHVSSCSCLKKSFGEYEINKILKKNNISFIEQYHNESCKFKDTNYYAYFDFYVDNQYIIEYDGEQHFNPQCFNNMTKDRILEAISKDKRSMISLKISGVNSIIFH